MRLGAVSILVTWFAVAAAAADAPRAALFDAGHDNRAGLVFSPDGSSAWWAEWNGPWGGDPASPRTIYVSRLRDGAWSAPQVAPFSGTYTDDDPFVSPDAQWLYFVSERPADDDDSDRDADIWRYRLTAPHDLERLDINSPAAAYSPVITADGALWFASAREGGAGQGDLYRAAPAADGFGPPEALGPAVNSPTGEWNLWVADAGDEILFEASSRPSNVSVPGDLYYSRRSVSGWTAAMPVVELNSAGSELLPRVHPDGGELYYTTAAHGGHARVVATNWHDVQSRLLTTYAPVLLVANRSSHEVVFIDVVSSEVIERIETGEGPHLLSNVDGSRVLATGYGEFPQPHDAPVAARPPFDTRLNSRLTLIDVADRSVLMDVRVENCARPHASWIVGDRGYLTCEDERQVLEIDLGSGDALRRLPTMQDGSHVLGFEPASRTLAVSNTGSGSVTLINIDSAATRIVESGAGSEGMTAIDGRFWVANAMEGTVSIVDAPTGAVIVRTGPLCNFPIALSTDARGQVWVACFGSSEIVALDRNDFNVRRRVGLDSRPLNLLLHPSRDIAYASIPRENAVAEIDLYTGAIVRRIHVGIEPDGLRWARQGPATDR